MYPTVLNGSEDCECDKENNKSPPTKPTGHPPCEKEDECIKDYVDPKQCEEIRLPHDRETPPPACSAKATMPNAAGPQTAAPANAPTIRLISGCCLQSISRDLVRTAKLQMRERRWDQRATRPRCGRHAPS